MVRNLFVVWLLTGIWHGANWTFILWGLFYFVIQLAEKFFGYPKKMSKTVGHLYTLFVVNLCWVLFRADDLYQAGRFIMNMFGLNRNGFVNDLFVLLIRENWVFLLAGFLFATPVVKHVNGYMYDNPKSKLTAVLAVGYPVVLIFLVIISISYLMSGSYNPFIYFNF